MRSELSGYLEVKKQAFKVRVCWVNSESNKEASVVGDGRGEPADESREVTEPGHFAPCCLW